MSWQKISQIARNNQLTWSTDQLSACQAVVTKCAMQCPVWSVSLPCVAGLHAYRDLEAPLMMMSWRGWGLLTGQMCTKLGSVNCATCLPVEASSKSMGCSATPPKSSLMYLQVQKPSEGRAVMLDLNSSSILVCFVCVWISECNQSAVCS